MVKISVIMEEDEAIVDGSFSTNYSSYTMIATSTIHDYMAKCLRVYRKNPRETENHQVSRFLNGLKPSIRDEIGLKVVYAFKHAYNLALRATVLTKKAI